MPPVYELVQGRYDGPTSSTEQDDDNTSEHEVEDPACKRNKHRVLKTRVQTAVGGGREWLREAGEG